MKQSFEIDHSKLSVLRPYNNDGYAAAAKKRSFAELYEDLPSPDEQFVFHNMFGCDEIEDLAKRMRPVKNMPHDYTMNKSIGREQYSPRMSEFIQKSVEFSIFFGSRQILSVYRDNMTRLSTCISMGRTSYVMESPFYMYSSRFSDIREYKLDFMRTILSRKKIRVTLRKVDGDQHPSCFTELSHWEISYGEGFDQTKSRISSFLVNGRLQVVHRSTFSLDRGLGDFIFRHFHGSNEKIVFVEKNLMILKRCISQGMKEIMFSVLFENKRKVSFFFSSSKKDIYDCFAFIPGEKRHMDEIALSAVTKFVVNNRRHYMPFPIEMMKTLLKKDMLIKMAAEPSINGVTEILIFCTDTGPVIKVSYSYK